MSGRAGRGTRAAGVWVLLAGAGLAGAALAPTLPVGLAAARAEEVPAPAGADSLLQRLPAGYDTLDTETVLRERSALLDSLLLPESALTDTLGLGMAADSLDAGGASAVRVRSPEWGRARGVRLSLRPGALATYNRVEGLRSGTGVGIRVGRGLRLEGAGAYGWSSDRWSGTAALTIGGARYGPGVRVAGGELVVPFGPNQGERATSLAALVAGQDRQDYLRRRSFGLTVWLVRTRATTLSADVYTHRDRSVAAKTDWNLLGRRGSIAAPNPAVLESESVGFRLAAARSLRDSLLVLGVEGGTIGRTDGGLDYDWMGWRLAARPVMPDGGVLTFSAEGVRLWNASPEVLVMPAVPRAAEDAASGDWVPYADPALPYLGGDGNLRGYNRLEFVGLQRLSLRAEYAIGADLLAMTRIPLLRSLHVQFIPFADAGTTREAPRDASSLIGTPLDGHWKSSFGLGLQRALWLPGLEVARLDLIRRADGAGDGVSVWFRVMPLGRGGE